MSERMKQNRELTLLAKIEFEDIYTGRRGSAVSEVR